MDDRRPAIVAVIISFLIMSGISMLVRLYVRKFIVKHIGWDDVICSIAMIPVVIHASLQLTATKYGLGIHITDVDYSMFPDMLHAIWYSGLVYNLSHTLIKLSYLAFYLRLLPHRRYRYAVYAAIFFVGSLGISFTFISIFMCTPIAKGWDPSVPGTCVSNTGYLISNSGLNMMADIIIFTLPIPTLWGLNLPLRQRLILAGTFMCGIVILAASGVRLGTVIAFTLPPSKDPTWDLGPIILWSEIEVNLAVILSCSAAFKALLQTLFPNFMGSLVSGSRSGTTKRSRGGGTQHNAYILQSRGHDDLTSFRTVIKASPPDSTSVDSRERIVERAEGDGVGGGSGGGGPRWPRLETTISVHSSSRESDDDDIARCGA